jgi:diguanylate cyclase (GGDEF)-like protein/PAS domain S-box-containing protein
MLNVLLVEDNPVYAKLVEGLLTQAEDGDFGVRTCRGLTEAAAALLGPAVDVIVLDLSLPEADGLDTLHRMVEMAGDLPIVVLTALNDEHVALQAVRDGAQDYLIKNQFTAAGLRRALLYGVERRTYLNALGDDGSILEGLLDSMIAAAGVLEAERDGDGRIVDFRWRLGNATCATVLGVSGRDLTGRRLSAVLPGMGTATVLDGLRTVVETQTRFEAEVQMLRGDTPVWLRLAAGRLGDGVALTASDVTTAKHQQEALRQAKEEAENAAQLKSRVLSVLSHEMRTPLNTVIGFIEMMDNEVLGPIAHPQYRAYVKDIAKASGQLRAILERLLEKTRFEELAKMETGYRQLIELAPDLICVCKDGKVMMMNAAGAAMVGVSPAEACVGRPFADFVHPDYRPVVTGGLALLMNDRARVPMKLLSLDGREVDVEMAATPVHHEDAEDAMLLVARDVTQRQIATRAIVQREERLRKIMDTMVDALVIVDQEGIVETFNPAAERIFGHAAGEVIGQSVNMLMPPEHAAHHDDYLARYLASGKSHVIGVGRDVEGKRKDGGLFPLEIALSELRIGGKRHFIAILRDITERKMNEERLRFLATRDHLTGLPNRALFLERLEEAVAAAEKAGHLVGILFVDLDHFKNINDSMGHHVGDGVLQAVGRLLEASVRPGDMVCHLSGDEFTVILDSLRDGQEAARLAEHLLDRLAQPFEVDGREVYTSASIGIVIYPDNAETIANLMRNVDTAVHQAKRQGRNTFTFYTEQLSEHMVRRLQIENGLRRCLERRELSVAYQPKVDLTTGEVTGAEALLRWVSDDLGFVSPGEFVPVAEETGLIVPIGDWVLREVCRQIERWRLDGRPPVRIAVNLSARQFRETSLTAQIMEILDTTGINAELLELELTESMLVENADEAIQALWALKGLGITLSIDDFGTGYSSLSYLKRFPIDSLKIDQSFVRDIPDSMDDMSITKAIISMGRSLDLKLVAEGVETVDQVVFLRENLCHVAQGYLFSRPVPAEDFMAFIDSHRPESVLGPPAAPRPEAVAGPAPPPRKAAAPT